MEDLSLQNQNYRPYRDEKTDILPHVSDEDCDVQQGSGTNTIKPEVIRKKVKQSLTKKRQKARKTKRGEAGVVTRKRRENHSVIKESRNGIW